MDDPALPLAEAERALADLERVNRWLFGLAAFRRVVLPLVLEGPRRVRLVDVGTGSGQVTADLARAARRRGVEVRVVGVDRKLSHLAFGRRRGHDQLRVVASADALPFADGAADRVVSNLFFHHFGGAGNRRIVAEMTRVGRHGAVIVDLRRSRLAAALFGVAARLLDLGALAAEDGRLSVLQSWSTAELARWEPARGATLRRRFPFRFSLVLGRPRL